ncbi:hypothetical protein EDM53_00115 [Rickettsiales endosymbiont of Peranema trichophorum]|uniref:hypothetical protein n=1 Tax=Rickettsiales endosymbiont of Peranema trichophorum TaxID=2486577 RepID=UPI00102345F8|nr:hypothetical protein [Rickettsiales endosymbiont of Peranema trichophorum]RZI47785.1 hypothetical protein EDM53_00115 [Rickettsiales endosymbiont of Peranema trichophorum]
MERTEFAQKLSVKLLEKGERALQKRGGDDRGGSGSDKGMSQNAKRERCGSSKGVVQKWQKRGAERQRRSGDDKGKALDYHAMCTNQDLV